MRPSENIEKLINKLEVEPRADASQRNINDALAAHKKVKSTTYPKPNIWNNIIKSPITKIAAAFLIISSLVACFVLYREVTNLRKKLKQRDTAVADTGDSASINFYFKEHQDTIARYTSHNLATEQSMQILIDYNDMLYYELIGNQPEFLNPGIIVRGPSLQNEISMPESPTISNGHSLTLPEAQETTDFDLVSPLWLEPCYTLDQIRRIEGCDTMQLLYTDGINSVSLFEQPLDGQRGLSPQDFREYAVFQNKGNDNE